MIIKSFEAFQKAKNKAFISRAKYAFKKRSLKLAGKLCNDIAKNLWARYLVVDSFGTVIFCWTLAGAYDWIPYCAPGLARIVDTLDFTVVAERRQAYASSKINSIVSY